MSEINIDTVKHTAKLARIELKDDHAAKSLHKDLDEILDYAHLLDELDLEDETPLFNALELNNVMREDVPESPLTQEEALSNSKSTLDGQFKVPKML